MFAVFVKINKEDIRDAFWIAESLPWVHRLAFSEPSLVVEVQIALRVQDNDQRVMDGVSPQLRCAGNYTFLVNRAKDLALMKRPGRWRIVKQRLRIQGPYRGCLPTQRGPEAGDRTCCLPSGVRAPSAGASVGL